jgi:hypothetical protein
VSLDNLSVVETGLQSVQKTVDKYTGQVKSETVTAAFFVAQGSRPMIVKSPSDSHATHYTGALVAVPEDVRNYFQMDLLNEKHRRFDDVFAPFMLDATDFRGDAFIGLGICIPVGLLAAWNIKKAVARIRNVQNSPIYQSLNHYGQPPELVAQAMDQEFKNVEDCSPITSVTLLRSWLLHRTFFHFTAMHMNEIIWVHRKVTKNYVNFIPAGKTYSIMIYDAGGHNIEVNGHRSEEKVSSLETALRMRIPWTVFGYTDEIRDIYKKSRKDLVEAVRTRHVEYLQKTAGSSAEA